MKNAVSAEVFSTDFTVMDDDSSVIEISNISEEIVEMISNEQASVLKPVGAIRVVSEEEFPVTFSIVGNDSELLKIGSVYKNIGKEVINDENELSVLEIGRDYEAARKEADNDVIYMSEPVDASEIISEETFPAAFSVIDDEISVLVIGGAY